LGTIIPSYPSKINKEFELTFLNEPGFSLPLMPFDKLKNIFIELNNNSEILKLGKAKWFDFGNFHTYYNSKKDFLETRSFNKIKVTSKVAENQTMNVKKIVFLLLF
jgi:hypothetical protein